MSGGIPVLRTRVYGRLVPRRTATASRSFGSTAARRNRYDATLANLKIGSHTRVIFQGFTGKQATANARESIEWGTNIVGGVAPGREGEHLGLPVLPTVRKAMEVLKPDATGVYVAAHQATGAIEEAIEAEVPLIVAVAEHIPLHDLIRIHAMLRTQFRSRLVGANSPGIISAVGRCRIGFQPLACFEPGRVGIVARSGTLSYETAASTLRSGLGQSMCIGVGGDMLPGTTLTDGLRVLAEDDSTEAIALVGEVGGDAEIEAAEWLDRYRKTTHRPKPVAALIAGHHAVQDTIMGHAGAIQLPGEASVSYKVKALQSAGALLVNHPSHFGAALKAQLDRRGGSDFPPAAPRAQRRSLHTLAARRPRGRSQASAPVITGQKRGFYLSQRAVIDLLRERGVPVRLPFEERHDAGGVLRDEGEHQLAVTIDRSKQKPVLVVSSARDRHDFYSARAKRFSLAYNAAGVLEFLEAPQLAEYLECAEPSLRQLVEALARLFLDKQAFLIKVNLAEESPGGLVVSSASIGLDDAAMKSGAADTQRMLRALYELPRQPEDEDPEDLEGQAVSEQAAKDGIVYVRLKDPRAHIGTRM
ncbi:succinyl-CoA synthetase-like protein [Xylariaceae sp. FL0804]|nr:succinyl-CoA synthetase-like protein [Xylariaceae sp. FL0804]